MGRTQRAVAGFDDVDYEPRNAVCLKTGNGSQLLANKKTGTSVLQP